MKYPRDTHTFLWIISNTESLSPNAKAIFEDRDNEIIVSAVSLWEIAIKSRIGKLNLNGLNVDELTDLIRRMDFSTIDLSADDASGYCNLRESTDRDPFDRMLIWQAITRGLTLLSADREFVKFKEFGLKLEW